MGKIPMGCAGVCTLFLQGVIYNEVAEVELLVDLVAAVLDGCLDDCGCQNINPLSAVRRCHPLA